MALATRCPNCQSLFRVVADQLKLRGGLVRCGSCRHVFDAISSLAYVDDTTLMPSSASNTQRRTNAAPPTLRIDLPAQTNATGDAASFAVSAARATSAAAAPVVSGPATPVTDAQRQARAKAREREEQRALEAAGVPTLIAPPPSLASHAEPDEHVTASPVAHDSALSAEGGAIQAKENTASAETASADKPTAATSKRKKGTSAEPAPAFLRNNERSRGFSIVFGGGSFFLILLLIAQLSVVFRTELMTRAPALRPYLLTLCRAFNCTLGWPMRPEQLAIVGSDLEAIPGTDLLELTAVIRNRSNFTLALPAVEVTLTDPQKRSLARKVFAPVDYLASSGEPSSRIDEGISAGSDYVVKITFEARGIKANGFVVYQFYL